MDFLKKHYEKIILSVVLLGMAVAAAFLPMKVSQVRADLQQVTQGIEPKKIKPIPELDMSTNAGFLQRVRNPSKLDLAATNHNLFNPIQWKRTADGRPVPSEQFGLSSLLLTNTTPLNLRIEYRGTRDTGGGQVYDFLVTREGGTNSASRGPSLVKIALGAKNDLFLLKEVRGPKEAPEELVIEMLESKQIASISRKKPYSEVMAYSADLRYEVATDKQTFQKSREGQKVTLSGTTYNIIAITADDITLEDSQTKKRTAIHLKTASR